MKATSYMQVIMRMSIGVIIFMLAGGIAYAQVPAVSEYYQVDPYWPKPLPNDWVTGNVGGACVDANDHVIIVSRTADEGNLSVKEMNIGRAAPPVIEFDAEGNVVNSWGDVNIVPLGIHDCYVDYEGNIWIGGNRDSIALGSSPDGILLLQIGEKGVFDTDDGTIQGKPNNSSKTHLHRPSSFAVDPENGDVYITDGYGNRRVVVFDKAGKYIRQFAVKLARPNMLISHRIDELSGDAYACSRLAHTTFKYVLDV